MNHILIVEDDADLAEIMQVHLRAAGFTSDTASTCAEARRLLGGQAYDLILLDVLLPDSTGDALCRDIRAEHDCPVIFMSCLDDSGTIVGALGSGGDDYVVKPIKYDELIARARANIRRARGARREKSDPDVLACGELRIDTRRHRALRGGEEVELSSIEYALLLYMARHPNTLLLYNELYQNVWDSDSLGDVRTVMVHISNLRKKIDPRRRGLIETVRGAGYIFSIG